MNNYQEFAAKRMVEMAARYQQTQAAAGLPVRPEDAQQLNGEHLPLVRTGADDADDDGDAADEWEVLS